MSLEIWSKFKNIAQANFNAPKFGYPCRTLHKPTDFLQNLLDIDSEPIVPMSALWYSDPIRPAPTYILRAAKRWTCTKIHQDSFKTEKLVCIETKEQTAYIDSARRPDQEYLFYGICHISFNALQTSWQNYNISARV